MKRLLKKIIIIFLGFITKFKRIYNKSDTNCVVIIKQDGIGDFVLFEPAALELRQYYADKKIILCCGNLVRSLALSSNLFDEVICFSRKDFELKQIIKTYKKISKIKSDILLHPTQPRTVEAEIMAFWINAKQKIASLGEAGALPLTLKKKFDNIYDKLIDTGEQNMTLIQSANFVRGIGDVSYKCSLPKISEVHNFPIYLPKEFYVVFLGGSTFNKLWPPERFYKVAEYISQNTSWDCIVCGTDIDREQEEEFRSQGPLNFYSFVGKTNLEELIYIISKSKLVLGNDTCAIHIANAVNVQSICVRGQFSGNKFYPYVVEELDSESVYPISVSSDPDCKWCTLKNGGYSCLSGNYHAHKKVDCLLNVQVSDVIQAIKKVI